MPLVQYELKSQFTGADYAWAQAIACVLLNRSSGKSVRWALPGLWELGRTPEDMLSATDADFGMALEKIGLVRQRVPVLRAVCYAFAKYKEKTGGGTLPLSEFSEIMGIGPYAIDSYRIFVLHERDFSPSDTKLQMHLDWIRMGYFKDT